MSIITVNNGSVYHFTTNGATGTSISQTSGTDRIFPTSYYNDILYAGPIDIDYERETVVNQKGPLFVNAVTYNIQRLNASIAPITHSIGDLELWSGSFDYNSSTIGGGALQCDTDQYPILIDFTSSITAVRTNYGIPAGTILHIYNYSNTATNLGLSLTGSFNMDTTQSLTTTDLAASISLIKVGGFTNKWLVLSQIGNWVAT